MKIKRYCGGNYLKACNSIIYWTINDKLFIELNWQGLKYCVYSNLQDLYEDKPIFEIWYEPETYFPNIDEQNLLEEERIDSEIETFLLDYINNGRHYETNSSWYREVQKR